MNIANKVLFTCVLTACMFTAGCQTVHPQIPPSRDEMAGSWVGTSRGSQQLVRMDFASDGSIEIIHGGKHWRSTKPLCEFPSAFDQEDYDLVATEDSSAGMIRFNRRFNALDVEFITDERRERFMFIKHAAATELVNN
jgi:hypothetical protein